MDLTRYKPTIIKTARGALAVLCLSVSLSILAPHNWRFDQLSHFQFQYATGAIILGSIFVVLRSYISTLICLAILAFSSFQITSAYQYAPSTTPAESAETLKIIQYNRRYTIQDHNKLTALIETENPDVIILQEATLSHSDFVKTELPNYPYQIHEPRKNAFGMVVASKLPISDTHIKYFDRIMLDNIRIKFTVTPWEGIPVDIYAIHPPPPVYKDVAKQRDMELSETAKDIKSDTGKNIILLGDFNATPFSTPFKKLIANTGLKNEITGFIPHMTWPSQFVVPIFQIPIDHILHKGDIELLKKYRSPALGSDHYPSVAVFVKKSPEE